MKKVLPVLAIVILIAGSFAISGCSNKPGDSQTNKPPANANASATSGPKTTATGTLTANPNPIKVCDGSETGVTTLTYNAQGTTEIEVRVGKPDGDLFVKTGPSGSWPTLKWVSNGMVFYLQDISGGKPLTPENTIATLTVNVTKEGCP